MKCVLGAVAVLLAATFAAAGNEEAEALARELVKNLKETITLLATIKDAKTAQAVRPELINLGKRLEVLNEKLTALKKDADKKEALLQLKKYAKEVTDLLPVLMKETERMAKLPGVREVLKDTPFFGNSRAQEQARRDRARVDVRQLTEAVQAYCLRNGQLPESLAILTKGERPAIGDLKALLDPWNRPYVYEPNILHAATGRPLIYSQGPNPGDPASRIRNWEAPKKP